jgi:hypothetical protein
VGRAGLYTAFVTRPRPGWARPCYGALHGACNGREPAGGDRVICDSGSESSQTQTSLTIFLRFGLIQEKMMPGAGRAAGPGQSEPRGAANGGAIGRSDVDARCACALRVAACDTGCSAPYPRNALRSAKGRCEPPRRYAPRVRTWTVDGTRATGDGCINGNRYQIACTRQGCPNRAKSRGSASRFGASTKMSASRFGDSAIRLS